MFSKMFRTKLDLELKSQRKSGSPFFNLRESITMILSKQSDEPKVSFVLLPLLKLSNKVQALLLPLSSLSLRVH